MTAKVFSQEIRNDDGEDLAIVTADACDGGWVSFDMPELGVTLTAGEAERLGQALIAAAAASKAQ